MKPNGLFITAASIFVMFGMLLGMRLYQRHAREAEAERLFESGAYAAALTLYEELEDEDAAALCRQRLREADYAEAERLVKAGQVMDIPVLDHVIIGNNSFASLKEKGLMGD